MKFWKRDIDTLKFIGGAKDGEELPSNGDFKNEIFFDKKPIISFYDSSVYGDHPPKPIHPKFYVYKFSHTAGRSAYYFFDRVQ